MKKILEKIKNFLFISGFIIDFIIGHIKEIISIIGIGTVLMIISLFCC